MPHLSPQLKSTLLELNLCSARQIASCARQVGHLSEGLPDFDSIWLDVLVQKKILTRFQADCLQNGQAHELKTGPLTLRDQLGGQTYLAFTATGQPIVLQAAANETETERRVIQSDLDSLKSNRRTAPDSLAVPIRSLEDGLPGLIDGLLVASPFAGDWTAAELIVRGGRLPWAAVRQIGTELLEALQWLHAQGCCHGNITTNSLRLTSTGKAVLVGAFGSRLKSSGISLSADLTYDEIRFVAPERVLNLHPASFRSDLYSVAMVLWNLLAARDPFPSTDPVARLTKAGQTNIPDVRNVVPDCPADLAMALQRYSKSNPQLRPASPEEAIELWQGNHPQQRNAIRSVVRKLPPGNEASSALPSSRSRMASLAPALAAATLMTVGFVGYGIQRGLIPDVASMSRWSRSEAESQSSRNRSGAQTVAVPKETRTETASTVDPHRVLPMPLPDAAGVVVLQSGRRYRAENLTFPGVMYVETSGSDIAQVVVSDSVPWAVSARQVSLTNVHIVRDDVSDESRDSAAIVVNADIVALKSCLVEATADERPANGINWLAKTGTVGTVRLEDCVVRCSGSAFTTDQVPQRFEIQNCLVLAKRSVVRATLAETTSENWPLTLHRTTVPASLTIADFLMPNAGVTPCRVTVTAGECVLTPTLALLQFASAKDSSAQKGRVEFRLPTRGNAAVVPPGTRMAVAWDSSLRSVVELPESSLTGNAVLPADPLFSNAGTGNKASPWEEFRLVDYEGPKLTRQMPGILVDQLPTPWTPSRRQAVPTVDVSVEPPTRSGFRSSGAE